MLEKLSQRLTNEFGKGFSIINLRRMRKFYCLFPIRSTVLNELSWSHYLELIKIEENPKRKFYMKECINSRWSVRELERQIGSLLYERLALSADKQKILELAENRLLKCFVIIDLKIGKVTHQDIGQMQMYVNYYDREIKKDDENPTGYIAFNIKEQNSSKIYFT